MEEARVIDLEGFRKRREEERRSTFALWGEETARSRFALPLWRAIYLADGERAGVVHLTETGSRRYNPFCVLDLAREPARLDFEPDFLVEAEGARALGVTDVPGRGVAVHLGRDGIRSWFLAVEGGEGRSGLDQGGREELLFVAGECSGLLLHRGLLLSGRIRPRLLDLVGSASG